jgi:uncharacterized protein YaiI (UPF0178 family)
MTRHALHEHVIVRIWIDADACPRDVKDVVFRASARLWGGTMCVLRVPRPP